MVEVRGDRRVDRGPELLRRLTVTWVKKEALRVLSFAVVVAVVVAALKLLNWIPGALEPGLMARYPSIEDAVAKLGLREVYVPAYFPESLGWPPAEILAQSRPYEAVIMQFVRARDGETALVISQARSADFEPEVAVRIHTVREIVPVDLDGRKARLEAGSCEDGSACSRIRWEEGEVRIVLTMRAPPAEIIRIARSMRR